jgi:hypothetical protein
VLTDQRSVLCRIAPNSSMISCYQRCLGARTARSVVADLAGTETQQLTAAPSAAALNQFMQITQLWQQCLQWATESMTGTQAQQIFSTRIQVVHDAVCIYADYGCRDAAEDVSRLGWGAGRMGG